MKITITQRQPMPYTHKQPHTITLLVENESEGERLAVNIDLQEAHRLIDAHGLSAYEEISRDTFIENMWDNKPTPEESIPSTPQ